MENREKAEKIVKKLVREGYIAYFAGGWVRDYLMGHPSADIDIATDAPPEKILDLFPYTVPVGIAFGVIIVVMEGHAFEVSTFRRDLEYEGGRKPTGIVLSSPEEDAVRRDFTINGMFYDPLENVVYDYVKGREDISRQVIRTIGDPFERFFEDRLRMIRAVRFAARFGFSIDPETQQGIIDYADSLFPAVAVERVWQELSKMAKAPRFDYALIELHRLGLLPVMLPGLTNVHLNDIKKRVANFAHFPPNTPTMIYIRELFPDSSIQELLVLTQMMRTSLHEMQVLKFVHTYHDKLYQENALSKKEWVYFYAHPEAELCIGVAAAKLDPVAREVFLEQHEARKKALDAHIERAKKKKALVHGELLRQHGIPPGKMMGALLREAEDLVIEHDLEDPDPVIALLKNSTNWRTL